jgi:transposase InsO family protein
MGKDQEWLRKTAVRRAHDGENHRSIWTSLKQSRTWFYNWLKRAQEDDPEWFKDRISGPENPANRTPEEIEKLVIMARHELYNKELFCGAQAIRWHLEDWNVRPMPSESTIARILRRNDLTHKRTGRYRPKGVPYPAPAAEKPNDVHQADFVGPRAMSPKSGSPKFYSLNCVDLVTGRCAIQPVTRGKSGMNDAFWAIWRRLGLPRYLQVDNEMTFYGSPAAPHTVGPLIRLCLPLGVEPVFAPAREPWRNGVVEKFQDYWNKRLWLTGDFGTVKELRVASLKLEERHNRHWRYSKLGGKTPLKTLAAMNAELRFPPLPRRPKDFGSVRPEAGRYHLIRFIRGDGKLDVFSEKFIVDPDLCYEYVWATVDVAKERLYLKHDGVPVDDWKYAVR